MKTRLIFLVGAAVMTATLTLPSVAAEKPAAAKKAPLSVEAPIQQIQKKDPTQSDALKFGELLFPKEISLSPSADLGGNGSFAVVSLSGPAPAGGLAVQLSSSNTAAATVPAFIPVLAGATTSSTVMVTTFPVAVLTPVTITASIGGRTRTAVLKVQPPVPLYIKFSPDPVTGGNQSIIGGNPTAGTVRLTGGAPAGGLAVQLLSSNTAVAAVPASVTVPAGERQASFVVATFPVAVAAGVTLTASIGTASTTSGATDNSPLNVLSPTLAGAPSALPSITGGQSSTATVRLTGNAPAGGLAVQLSSSNTAVATVPASITVPAGTRDTSFTIETGKVAASTAATIKASIGTLERSYLLTINP